VRNSLDETPLEDEDASKKLIAAIKNTPYNGDLALIPHFGIWNPSISEAAELVVVDMWFSGQLEGVDVPEDFDGDARAPWLKAALADMTREFEALLLSAIDSGRLKASVVRRELDERVIPEETHVEYDRLVEWMEERGLVPGDHMGGWVHDEATIAELICDEVVFLRNASISHYRELSRIEAQRRDAKYGLLEETQQLDEAQDLLSVGSESS
jgi:hypothetical protein